jgi:hypothetical protein
MANKLKTRARDVQGSAAIARVMSGAGAGTDPISIGPDRSIRIDLAKLPAPARMYDADVAWLVDSPGRVSFMFGKVNAAKTMFRTRLEVRYPAEDFYRFFWFNGNDLRPRIDKYVGRWPEAARARVVESIGLESERDHSEWASFDCISQAGTQACIDFFLLPAPGLVRFSSGRGSGGLSLEPVVRVQLTVFDLARLLHDADAVAARIREVIPDVDEHLPVREESKATGGDL